MQADRLFMRNVAMLDEMVGDLRTFYNTRDMLQDDEDDARYAAAIHLMDAIHAVRHAREALGGDV